MELRRYRQAKQAFQRAAWILEKTLGKYDPTYGLLRSRLAESQAKLGKYDDAIANYRESLEVLSGYRALKGPVSRQYACVLLEAGMGAEIKAGPWC